MDHKLSILALKVKVKAQGHMCHRINYDTLTCKTASKSDL